MNHSTKIQYVTLKGVVTHRLKTTSQETHTWLGDIYCKEDLLDWLTCMVWAIHQWPAAHCRGWQQGSCSVHKAESLSSLFPVLKADRIPGWSVSYAGRSKQLESDMSRQWSSSNITDRCSYQQEVKAGRHSLASSSGLFIAEHPADLRKGLPSSISPAWNSLKCPSQIHPEECLLPDLRSHQVDPQN